MLEGVKSVGYYTVLGAAAGAVVGAGVGLANVPLICGFAAVQATFFNQFLNGKSPSNLDSGFKLFKSCQMALPIGGALGFGVAGGAIGLIYGISKEILKTCRAQQRIPLEAARG